MTSDESIEPQPQFIKRMSGFTRLYASCMISDAAGEINTSFGVDQAWLFISRILNLNPRSTITAIVLTNFVSVCASSLISVYGNQARKLLSFIHQRFLPAVKEVTDENEDGGAYEKLSLLVTEMVSSRHVNPPEGMLSRTFWYT